MAVKVTFCPLAIDFVAGVMLMPVSVAVFTVRFAVGDVVPLSDAVMAALPDATPVATPVPALIVAMPVLPDDQVTWLVRSAVVPFE